MIGNYKDCGGRQDEASFWDQQEVVGFELPDIARFARTEDEEQPKEIHVVLESQFQRPTHFDQITSNNSFHLSSIVFVFLCVCGKPL